MMRRICAIVVLLEVSAFLCRAQGVRITEVMANPNEAQGGQKAGEFVELYNAGNAPVNLRGWAIADRDAKDALVPFRAGTSLFLKVQAFAVILDPDYKGAYTIPPDVLLLKPSNAAIGNGLSSSDPVRLLDAGGKVADTFTPPTSARSGVSYERVNIAAPDSPENWRASSDPTGATPGRPTTALSERTTARLAESSPIVQVVINELLARPKPDQPEWVELWNHLELAAKTNGWTLADAQADGRQATVPLPEAVIPANGYAILTRSAADFRDAHPETPPETPVIEMPLPTLNDDGDTLTLRANGTVLDRVRYGSTDTEPGRSLEREDPALDSGNGNLLPSVHAKGSTPGAENSIRSDSKSGKTLRVYPNPYDPRQGPLRLYYDAPASSKVTLRLYHSSGGVVRSLVEEGANGGSRTVEWDGKDDKGEVVPAGVYVALLLVLTGQTPIADAVPIVVEMP